MFSAAEVLVRLRSGLRDQIAGPVQYPSLPLFIIILFIIFIVMIIIKMTIIITDNHGHSYCHYDNKCCQNNNYDFLHNLNPQNQHDFKTRCCPKAEQDSLT